MPGRTVFFVSESTGITAETLGQSQLSQFSHEVKFKTIYMPFISTPGKARDLAARVDKPAVLEANRPIVFATMPEIEIREILRGASCLYIELFDTFIGPLAEELGVGPSGEKGLSHGFSNNDTYENRMHTINFAMTNDDGACIDHRSGASEPDQGRAQKRKRLCITGALQKGDPHGGTDIQTAQNQNVGHHQ